MAEAACITGGAKRIGRAVAHGLAERGYDIALHYRASKAEADKLAAEIHKKGCECALFQADLENREDVKNLIPRVINHFPDCRLLVNNASIFYRMEFLETDEKNLDQFLQIHLKTPFFLSQAFAKYCEKGLIINMLDSKISKNPIRYFSYVLSKKALAALTTLSAKALGPEVRVNGIAPGIILPSSESSEKEIEQMAAQLPLGKKGNTGDVVSAVFSLIDNTYMTGQILYVDGGDHLK